MHSDITVYLNPGTYRLTTPLSFTAADSGTNGYSVDWTSTADASTLISGAVQARGWHIVNAAKNIWIAHVAPGLQTRQIYVNGMRASIASGAVRGHVTETAYGLDIFPNFTSGWSTKGLEFVWQTDLGPWTEAVCPVGSISADFVNVANPCWDNSTRRHQNYVTWGSLWHPTYVEGALPLLERPGQYYLDSRQGAIYYVPRPGQDMTTADVEVPVLHRLITAVGNAAKPIVGLSFSNLTFSYATWLQPGTSNGLSEVQANYSLTGNGAYAREGLCQYSSRGSCPYGAWTKEPGNLELGFDRHINFLNDRFVHLGAAGLDLGDGSQFDSVVGSAFTDISGNGLEIGGVDYPLKTGPYETKGVLVADNHFYGLPVQYEGGVAVLVGYVCGTTITHNQIDHVAYSGISIGWGGWPDKGYKPAQPNISRGNVISDNLILDFMQLLSDGGGIYVQGITGTKMSTGLRVVGNLISGELGWSRALHSDDSATWVTYSRNVLYGNAYDWGSNHYDTTTHNGYNDPEVLTHNYWEQGDPTTYSNGLVETSNTVITGPDQAPASVVDGAGIQSEYASILDWTPLGGQAPNSPQQLRVLYAFRGNAYLTWKPSFAEGSSPVTNYTVQACARNRDSDLGQCGQPVGTPVDVSAQNFDNTGYVVVPNLRDGSWYSFQVTAWNAQGASTPSIPSTYVRPVSGAPKRPNRPGSIFVRAAPRGVVLQWWPPSSAGGWFDHFAVRPVMAYAITSSDGEMTFAVTSLSQMYISNSGGRTMYAIAGLTPGKRYRFSVASVNPSGSSTSKWSHWVTPRR